MLEKIEIKVADVDIQILYAHKKVCFSAHIFIIFTEASSPSPAIRRALAEHLLAIFCSGPQRDIGG